MSARHVVCDRVKPYKMVYYLVQEMINSNSQVSCYFFRICCHIFDEQS